MEKDGLLFILVCFGAGTPIWLMFLVTLGSILLAIVSGIEWLFLRREPTVLQRFVSFVDKLPKPILQN